MNPINNKKLFFPKCYGDRRKNLSKQKFVKIDEWQKTYQGPSFRFSTLKSFCVHLNFVHGQEYANIGYKQCQFTKLNVQCFLTKVVQSGKSTTKLNLPTMRCLRLLFFQTGVDILTKKGKLGYVHVSLKCLLSYKLGQLQMANISSWSNSCAYKQYLHTYLDLFYEIILPWMSRLCILQRPKMKRDDKLLL